MHLPDAVEDELSLFTTGVPHSAKADRGAGFAVLLTHDLISRQRHAQSVWIADEGTGWTVSKHWQVLLEVPFAVQACACDERNQ